MNILIIHTAFIGDIVLSTALVSKVKEKYPDSDIYYLTTPLGKEILKNNTIPCIVVIKNSEVSLLDFKDIQNY